MVTKQVENILRNRITREGFWNNGKWYILGQNKLRDDKEKRGMNPDGTIIDTTNIDTPVWCAKCGLECESEAIVKDGKPYHYNCSGVEL